MSNSIARPRKRPRVRSRNFRSFFWVVKREAALWIARGDVTLLSSEQDRARVASWDGRYLERVVAWSLRAYPERRIKP